MKMGLIVFLILLCACAKAPPKPENPEENSIQELTFEKGLRALERENYVEASRIFDALLVAKPATEFDLVTLYNSGAAYEGQANCPKAADRYRSVVRAAGNRFPRIEAQSLFRLSLMYECLGQDAKAIAALIDARKRGKSLPFETLSAEIPARLAAAYSRIGNRAKAIEYFGIASQGLKKIVAREQGSKQSETLGRTLYMMGQLTASQRAASVSSDSFVQSVLMQQSYLLQAVELNHPVWSKRSAEDLVVAYDNFWKFKFEDDEKKRAFYIRGIQAAQELKKIRLPGATGLVQDVFAHIEKTESRLQAELAKLGVTNPQTAEAQKREALKRSGRLINPEKPKATRKQ